MTKDEIDEWAKEFAAALSVGGERVPLDRVIASRLAAFEALRNEGLTWRAIAAILTRAGARRKDNQPISPDQLRADVSRLLRRRVEPAAAPSPLLPCPPTTKPKAMPRRRSHPPPKPRQSPDAAAPGREQRRMPDAGGKDVQESEILAALNQLQKR